VKHDQNKRLRLLTIVEHIELRLHNRPLPKRRVGCSGERGLATGDLDDGIIYLSQSVRETCLGHVSYDAMLTKLTREMRSMRVGVSLSINWERKGL
jgi:hypothetical protein